MRIVLRLYAALFSCLFAIIFIAQILGFAGLYRPVFAIPATLITAILAYWAYQKFPLDLKPQENNSRLLLFASLLLVILVFLIRMLLWPHSELGKLIPADFFAYHGIKALELARSGSMWNLAIPYGDYPNGYESLASFGLVLIGDIRILGFFHALIFLLSWLTLALLLVRYAAMPLNFALFFTALVFFIPPVYSLFTSIGKNDALLSLTILIAILHAPISSRSFHPLGLAYATMLSLAIKASGLYILFYLWALVMLFWFLAWREGKAKNFLNPAIFLLCIAIMFVGGLWVIRNYLLMGEVLTSEVRSFFVTSIGANLGNPSLYNAGNESLGLFIALGLLSLMAALAFKRWGWEMALLLAVIALTFAVTPLSAFHTIQSPILHVEWRYVLHGTLLLVLLFLALFWQSFGPKIQSWRFSATASLIVTFAILIALNPFELFSYDSSRSEQFIDPNGEAQSVYDEVAKLEEGIVYMANGNWFALSYANPNITIMQGTRYPLGRGDIYPVPIPDYAFFIGRLARREPNFSSLGLDYNWELIYEDEAGRLYRRIP